MGRIALRRNWRSSCYGSRDQHGIRTISRTMLLHGNGPARALRGTIQDGGGAPKDTAAEIAAERLFQEKVDAYIRQHGPHRRAEAERFVRMQVAAAAARGSVPTAGKGNRQCSSRMISDGFQSPWLPNPAAARAQADEWAGRMCGQAGRVCSGVTCRTQNFGLGRSPDIVTSCTASARRRYETCEGPNAVSRQ